MMSGSWPPVQGWPPDYPDLAGEVEGYERFGWLNRLPEATSDISRLSFERIYNSRWFAQIVEIRDADAGFVFSVLTVTGKADKSYSAMVGIDFRRDSPGMVGAGSENRLK
jgi:hypothetical protein